MPEDMLIKIVRYGKFDEIEYGTDHPSENSLDTWDRWDCVIRNSSTINALRNNVINFMSKSGY